MSSRLRNFEIASGLVEGDDLGAPFNDGDFYKLAALHSRHGRQ